MSDESKWVEQEKVGIFDFKNEGDYLIGKLLNAESKVGPNESILYTLKKEDGTLVKIWGSHILDSRMIGIEFKTEVKIVFKGWVKPKKGKDYKNFSVFYAKVGAPST